jgi:predicted transcriptional regulator
MIRHRPGSNAQLGRSYSRLLKRVVVLASARIQRRSVKGYEFMIRPQRSSETQKRLDHLRQRHRVHKGKRSESPLEQARRLLAVAAILASARSQGLTAESVTERVREQTSKQWCERTVRRDLDALHNMGIVNQTDGRKRGCGNPYVWLGHSKNLTRVVLQAAENTASKVAGPCADPAAWNHHVPGSGRHFSSRFCIRPRTADRWALDRHRQPRRTNGLRVPWIPPACARDGSIAGELLPVTALETNSSRTKEC